MKSYDQSRDGSNLIRTISYHNSSQGWLSHQSPDLSNLPNQPFESTFWINLYNQSFDWISTATDLWYVASFDKYIYVGGCTPTY